MPLENPGFEVFRQRDAQELIVAEGWEYFYRPQQSGDESWANRRPEYKPAAPYHNRIRAGENSQQWFTWSGTHDAGIYQVISVQPGSKVFAHVWAQMWCMTADNKPGVNNIRFMVGIDPSGGVDAFADSVVWGEELRLVNDTWMRLSSKEVEAQGSQVTVFLRSIAVYPLRDNNIYVDDAELIVDGEAEPEPEPAEGGTKVYIHNGCDELITINLAWSLTEVRDEGDMLVLYDSSGQPGFYVKKEWLVGISLSKQA